MESVVDVRVYLKSMTNIPTSADHLYGVMVVSLPLCKEKVLSPGLIRVPECEMSLAMRL